MTARFKKVLFSALTLFAVGAIYATIIHLTHKNIPCVFKLITGFQCPGCGVSRMCFCMLLFDFPGAFQANPLIFCMLPLIALTAGRMIYVYVRYGRKREKLTQISIYVMIVALLIFGVLRNIF